MDTSSHEALLSSMIPEVTGSATLDAVAFGSMGAFGIIVTAIKNDLVDETNPDVRAYAERVISHLTSFLSQDQDKSKDTLDWFAKGVAG